MGCVDQARELGAPRAQAMDRGSQEAAAPQRAAIALANKLVHIAWSVLARDLARWIRSQKHRGHIPVIIATGYGDRVQEAADDGFKILRNPFDVPLLQEAIKHTQQKSLHDASSPHRSQV